MIAKFCLIFSVLLHISEGNLRCLPYSDNSRHIVGSGAAMALLGSTVDEGENLDALSDIHHANAMIREDVKDGEVQ